MLEHIRETIELQERVRAAADMFLIYLAETGTDPAAATVTGVFQWVAARLGNPTVTVLQRLEDKIVSERKNSCHPCP